MAENVLPELDSTRKKFEDLEISNVVKESEKAASLVNESRSKILSDGKLELKRSSEEVSSVSAINKEFQSNSYKITSVIASAETSDQELKSVIQEEPAYKKFRYSVSESADQTESTLILPYKYKFLAEVFYILDIVVEMLLKRKERITFEKVQPYMQMMINKDFTMTHFGQIMNVFPRAYRLAYEKIDSYSVNKASSPYHLVITPNLNNVKGANDTSKRQKKFLKTSFVHITPQQLLERKNIFSRNLLRIVKKHHQNFLQKLNFPPVTDENIVRWHPEFKVDSVPDIPTAVFPEIPKMKI